MRAREGEGIGAATPSGVSSEDLKKKGKKPAAAAAAGTAATGTAAGGTAAAGPAAGAAGGRKWRCSVDASFKQLKTALQQNVCRYRGFILDGVVSSYEDCKNLFLSPQKQPEENAETAAAAGAAAAGPDITAAAGAAGEGEEAAGVVAAASYMPQFVISLRASEELCEKRIMHLQQSSVIQSYNDREGFKKRMQLYIHHNENCDGKPTLTDFFQVL